MSEDKKDFVVKDKRRLAESEPDNKPQGGPTPSPEGQDAHSGSGGGDAPRSPADSQLPKIDFATFVFSLNSAVLVHLGVIGDPASGQSAKDLPLAKQTIDILGMLEEKTRGNLTSDEENMLKNILYDLRIRYVRRDPLTQATPSASVGEVLAPAKINLFLHVTGRRQDGYHELFSLMCCVGLYDTLVIEFGGRGIAVDCTDPWVPDDETNTAYRAAARFFEALAANRERSPGGVRIHIDKQIPVAAGLGGGSSNAAAVLNALNRRCGGPFSRDELMALALEVGADVPFFLHRQPALATGVGERLQPVAGLVPQKVVLVCPGYPVSTGQVFRNLNLALTKGEKKPKSCLLNAQKIDIKRCLHNDLETVTLAMHPDIAHIKSRLADHGAIGALMSGSGPTVFGLFESDQSAANAYQRLLNENLGRVFLADMPV